LSKAVSALAKEFDWLDDPATEGGNTYVNNGYKDYTLLQALEPAESTYVADFALTQDERSIADYTKTGILHNFVPKDYAAVGLSEKDTEPLKGIHFNKIFWTNTNFTNVTGKTLYNIWQLSGTKYDSSAKQYVEDGTADHIAKVSFQTPVTEQINMSFLLACQDPANQARIEKAYKDYYGHEWNNSAKYANAGAEWVEGFLYTVKSTGRFHDSDGSAMKQYQLKDDWAAGYVYFGAYSKMKDAAGKWYAVSGQDTDPILSGLIETEGDNAGKVNAMKTVKWDWEINGFNGYFYTMDSQIVNNAEHPYMACLFARYLLNGDFYKSAIYSDKTPNEDGTNGNQYGYYYPGEMPAYSASETKPVSNSYDWSKDTWKSVSLVENYSYLKDVKAAKVAYINSLIG
ncbi:MAG: hypothetical protein MJ248_07055, partial [Bacilli bacterium]|nr:hypothetical protein [Bacilli bacterium]